MPAKKTRKRAAGAPVVECSPRLALTLVALSAAFPCGMAPVGDKGAWVYVKDYEKSIRLLKQALKLAGVRE